MQKKSKVSLNLKPSSPRLPSPAAQSNGGQAKPLTSSILVSGSLTYDTIFGLRGKIKEQIVLEKGRLGNQSLMFTGREKQVYFGGTGGNIAYGLGKLGISPLLVSVVGQDFDVFERHLKKLGVQLRVKKVKNEYCSTFYAMADENGEQIGVYQPGCADKHLIPLKLSQVMSQSEIKNTKIAFFSAGIAESIVKQMEEFRKINKTALVFFDPGQILSFSFTLPLLKRAFKAANVGIFNETEFNLFKSKFNLGVDEIFSSGLQSVIETKGADGSSLYEMKTGSLVTIDISAIKVKKVVDPTGAGDAFRSGLISGLVSGKSMTESMKMGARLGAKCVQKQGGQTY